MKITSVVLSSLAVLTSLAALTVSIISLVHKRI